MAYKFWRTTEERYLRDNALLPLCELASVLGRTEVSVRVRMKLLGIYRGVERSTEIIDKRGVKVINVRRRWWLKDSVKFDRYITQMHREVG
jgi:hypothetical protein